MKLKVAKAPVAVSPIAAIERYIPVVDAKDAGESWEVEEYAARYPTIGCVQYDSKLPAHLLGEMDDRANEILKLFCGHTYQLELQNRRADPDGIDGTDIFDIEATTVGEMCEKCACAISSRAFERASDCAQDLIWDLGRDRRADGPAEDVEPAGPGL